MLRCFYLEVHGHKSCGEGFNPVTYLIFGLCSKSLEFFEIRTVMSKKIFSENVKNVCRDHTRRIHQVALHV